jgi:hypothetical protein
MIVQNWSFMIGSISSNPNVCGAETSTFNSWGKMEWHVQLPDSNSIPQYWPATPLSEHHLWAFEHRESAALLNTWNFEPEDFQIREHAKYQRCVGLCTISSEIGTPSLTL